MSDLSDFSDQTPKKRSIRDNKKNKKKIIKKNIIHLTKDSRIECHYDYVLISSPISCTLTLPPLTSQPCAKNILMKGHPIVFCSSGADHYIKTYDDDNIILDHVDKTIIKMENKEKISLIPMGNTWYKF